MSSRCESVERVRVSIRFARFSGMPCGTRHDWLGIFTALVQDYLSENFSREFPFSGQAKRVSS